MLFLAHNLDAGLMGFLHVEPALYEIPRDPKTDNIPSHRDKEKGGTKRGHEEEEEEEEIGRAVSSEFGARRDGVCYNFSIDHSRSAGCPRKSVDESQRNLHARRRKKSYRTENTEYFIHSNGGWLEGCADAQSCLGDRSV